MLTGHGRSREISFSHHLLLSRLNGISTLFWHHQWKVFFGSSKLDRAAESSCVLWKSRHYFMWWVLSFIHIYSIFLSSHKKVANGNGFLMKSLPQTSQQVFCNIFFFFFYLFEGNKLDLEYLRVVNSQRARSLAEKYDVPYIETSAYTGKLFCLKFSINLEF
jgi:Ras family